MLVKLQKRVKRDNSVENDRIHRQNKKVYTTLNTHPAGGDANVEHLLKLSIMQ